MIYTNPTFLTPALNNPCMDSMNFLNEIAERHPAAISFAAGRPSEDSLSILRVTQYLDSYVKYLTEELRLTPENVTRKILQYGAAAGIINDILSKMLEIDEDLHVAPQDIVVTVGAQEALFLLMRVLRADENDIVFTADPTYVGLQGAAVLADMTIETIPRTHNGAWDIDRLVALATELTETDVRPKAVYVIPDADNPTGHTMDLAERRALLSAAIELDILIIEDTTYRSLSQSHDYPSLKALDSTDQVISVSSFAKTLAPGIRVGYAVITQSRHDSRMADAVTSLKSMLTVNTSPLAQAVAGGAIISNSFSLRAANQQAALLYKDKLLRLKNQLDCHLSPIPGVSYAVPDSGFFATLTLPFEVTQEHLHDSANRFGVIWTPMALFSKSTLARHQIRLSISVLTDGEIDTGVQRLTQFISSYTQGSSVDNKVPGAIDAPGH